MEVKKIEFNGDDLNSFLSIRKLFKFKIGASEIAAMLGLNPYISNVKLFYEKLGIKYVSNSEKERMAWGNLLEEPIATVLKYYDFEKDTFGENFSKGLVINKVEKVNYILYSQLYNVSIDYTVNNSIAELKTAYKLFDLEDIIHYVYQTLLQMRHSDKKHAYIVIFSGYKLRIFEVDYYQMFEQFRTTEKEFWKNIDEITLDFRNRLMSAEVYANKYLETGDEDMFHKIGVYEPELIGTDEFKWKIPVEKSIEIDATDIRNISRLKKIVTVKDNISKLMEEKKQLEAEIKSMLNEKSYLTFNDKIIATYKANKNGSRVFRLNKNKVNEL